MKVITVPLAYTNTYLIEGQDGWVMVDAGRQSMTPFFLRRLSRLGIHPRDIRLLIITHAHFDHVGSLAAIKKQCGCEVLAHRSEAAIIESAQVVIPPGTNTLGKVVSWMGNHSKILLSFPAAMVELPIESDFNLTRYGVYGEVLPTPGHTPGSLSVLLRDGQAIVGDLAMNFGGRTNFPIFAEQPEQIRLSWQKLIERGATAIYPAHGRRFPSSQLQ